MGSDVTEAVLRYHLWVIGSFGTLYEGWGSRQGVCVAVIDAGQRHGGHVCVPRQCRER